MATFRMTTYPPPLAAPGLQVDGLQVDYHSLIEHAADPMLLLEPEHWRVVDANAHACALFGTAPGALLGKSLTDLMPPSQPDGAASRDAIAAQLRAVPDRVTQVFPFAFQDARGRALECEVQLAPLPAPGRILTHARLTDVGERNRADRLRAGQNRVLELMASGAPLRQTLDQLVLLIESQSPDVLCSVMALDEDGVRMRSISGPHLPAAYLAALDGVAIGPAVGSCGTAMFRKRLVVVDDIQSDPLWAPYTGLVAPYGLRACWSTPIFLERQQVLGSFAMYYREPRAPGRDDLRLIGVATHLAGLALERTRREGELARYREHLEELVRARTAELTRAKEDADRVNQDLAATLATLSLTQEELVRRDKLAALGSLVAGVAHELNTPIGNSLIMATSMSEQLGGLAAELADGLRRSHLDNYLARTGEASKLLLRNLQRAADLVASFKRLAVAHGDAERSLFSASELVAELAPTLRIGAREHNITLEIALEPGLIMESYPGALSQALCNLFENCLVHAFEQRSDCRMRLAAGMRDPDTVAISVADNGIGMAPETMARVYDPFFTTKLGSGGSGLGLHVTHNLVAGTLGGRIELHSAPGEGSTFTLLLPLVAPTHGAPALPQPSRA